MPGPRRLWDSNVVIGYLAGYESIGDACNNIIRRAERGELEIAVSLIATIEVAYLTGLDDQTSEAMIRELFGREYIVPIAIDMRVAEIARELIRKYRTGPKLKPADATHLATALRWKIPLVETTDRGLLKLNGKEGSPLVTIREPSIEGTIPMPGV